MNRPLARFGLSALGLLILLARPTAQATVDPWFGRQTKPQDFDAPKEFTGTFKIELPKNWQLAPGHTGTIFSLVEKTKKWETGGLITLEYQRLQAPLNPTLIAEAVERQLQEVQKREVSGRQWISGSKSAAFGPIIFMQYDRPGISGHDDHVAQYKMPIGLTMYRLICIAPTASIEKYRPIFAHVAASFALLKAGS